MKNGDWRINRSKSMLPSARKALHESLRREVVQLLGSVCIKCGYDDHRALQVDHVHGGGTHELKRYSGSSYLYKVRKEITSGRYQLLCANCNWIKRNELKEVRKVYSDDHVFPQESPHVQDYSKRKRRKKCVKG